MIKINRTSEKAKIPTKGSEFAAGYDLYSIEDNTTLSPGERKLFKTGIKIQLPRGHYGRISPRSGLALKHGIDVLAGIIDEDFLGEIGIILINLGSNSYHVDTSKPIAQMIIAKYHSENFIEVNESELEKTGRGEGGFGSSDLVKEGSKIIDDRKNEPSLPLWDIIGNQHKEKQ